LAEECFHSDELWDEQLVCPPRDLIPFIGSRNRVHELLNRRCSLTLKMIWRLHEGLGIPAESLYPALINFIFVDFD
jgi:plasmid maintenance system antidote protein VapI